MSLQILQLNTYKATNKEALFAFLKNHTYDLLSLQEIAGGVMSPYTIDTLKTIQEITNYPADFVSSLSLVNNPTSYFGNATLYNPQKLTKKSIKTLWLKENFEISDLSAVRIEDYPRVVLITEFEYQKKTCMLLNAHLAWGPTPDDAEYKIEQAQILENYIQTLSVPFILTGDFNVTPTTKVCGLFNSLARNLTAEFGITNTLNPRLHRVTHLFPHGLAVDFIFVSKEFVVKKFECLDSDDISDHLGLVAEVEL